MINKISQRDLETLSAYMDGELSLRARQQLEKRLGQESDLRGALEELRQSQAMMRSAPYLRAPRNFTLTPQMVGKPVRQPAYAGAFAALRMVSAFAAVLLLFTVLAEWFVQPRQTAMIPVVQEVAPAAEGTPFFESVPADEPVEKLAMPEAVEAPAAEEEGIPLEPSGGGALPTEGVADLAMAPTPAGPRLLTPTATQVPTKVPFNTPTSIPQAEEVRATESSQLPWRMLQLSLVVLAILSGALAFYLRRSAL